MHVHERGDELYYILEGVFEIRCGPKQFTAEAGAMAVLPRNVPHAFRNPGPSTARALTLFIPGGFDTFVRELSELSLDSAAEERDAVRRRHGIQMLSPASQAFRRNALRISSAKHRFVTVTNRYEIACEHWRRKFDTVPGTDPSSISSQDRGAALAQGH